jgi:hypothetical protein
MSAATTGLGFQLWTENISTDNVMQRYLLTASNQFYENDAMLLVDGIAGQTSSQTAIPSHIFVTMITDSTMLRPGTQNLTTTLGERGLMVPTGAVAGGIGLLNFWTPLAGNSVPTINGTAANANSTATSVLVTFTGSTNDFATGTVYIPSLQQQRTITADVVGTGVHTFTVTPAFSRAVTTGDTVIAVPFSAGSLGVKLAPTVTYQGVSTAVADKTGGHVNIVAVVLGPIQEGPNLGNTISSINGGQPYAVVNFS